MVTPALNHAAGADRSRDGRREPWADWPVGVVAVSGDGLVTSANGAALALFAGFGAMVRGADLYALLTDAAPDLRSAASRLAPGASLRRRVRGPAGVALALMLNRDQDGAMTLLATDDSGAVLAEEEAQRGSARFAAVADWAPRAAIFGLDRDGRITSWSASAARFEGLDAQDVVGMPLETLFDRSSFAADAALLIAEAARAGESTAASWRFGQEGSPAWVSLTLRAVRLADGALDGFVAIARDTTVVNAREAELRRLAETDPLTGALNRRAFFETVRAAEATLRRRPGPALAAIAFDLDGFKGLNDTHGHAAGDAALKALAEAARADVRAGDILGRLGGDEFAVALPRADLSRAAAVAQRLRVTVEALEVKAAGRPIRFTASFGVAAPLSEAETFEQTLARADAALYRAKSGGRNRVELG